MTTSFPSPSLHLASPSTVGAPPPPPPPYSMPQESLANETELALLCLDHLRGLVRQVPAQKLSRQGLDASYLTMACWALNRALTEPTLKTEGTDAFGSSQEPTTVHDDAQHEFPSLSIMQQEVLGRDDDDHSITETKEATDDHDYNDAHASNTFRFYALEGLANSPYSMSELVAAGLVGLGSRSRRAAEADLVQTQVFQQFLQAVETKGFFEHHVHDAAYQERYQKVVRKFRTKLALKAGATATGAADLMALSAADQQRNYRRAWMSQQQDEQGMLDHKVAHLSSLAEHKADFCSKLLFGAPSQQQQQQQQVDHDRESMVSVENPFDLEEAERLKTLGNSHMQRKEYTQAAELYTQALKLSPAGPHSHVYFSNRAAALVSLKQFDDAILDSERSLALKPDYGKAHARLGLAHFLLGNYRQAMEAYTVALKYEPDNKSSKNYLEKAAKRLAEQGEKTNDTQASFSVVSEWEKSNKHGTASNDMDKGKYVAEHKDAEKWKNKGNLAMGSRDYQQALDAYTQAIELCPNGPQSHVYYSNRAAALCYLERYQEAEQDSKQSLALNPSYGKAHARLGLTRFFLQDYAGAVEAYTCALEYDPDNAASQSYLAKARARLDAAERDAVARRMMDDPDLRSLTKKAVAMSQSSRN